MLGPNCTCTTALATLAEGGDIIDMEYSSFLFAAVTCVLTTNLFFYARRAQLANHVAPRPVMVAAATSSLATAIDNQTGGIATLVWKAVMLALAGAIAVGLAFASWMLWQAVVNFDSSPLRPWEGAVFHDGAIRHRDGLCYLDFVPNELQREALKELGFFPKWHVVKRYYALHHLAPPRIQLRSGTTAHVQLLGKLDGYAHVRVGARRCRRLAMEVAAGVPAATSLGEGRFTSDFAVTQPRGEWSYHPPSHSGPFIAPMHSANVRGYCYLHLFDARYQATVEAWLGRFPRSRRVKDVAGEFPHFLASGTFVMTVALQRRMLVAHVSPDDAGVDASALVEMLPIHRVMLGASGQRNLPREDRSTRRGRRGPSSSGTAAETGDRVRAENRPAVFTMEALHPALRAEIIAGVPAGTSLGGGGWTSDHNQTQPFGDWRVTWGAMTHSGQYRLALHSPNTPGYCYLNLFSPRYRATVEAWLGKYPHADRVREVSNDNLTWLDRYFYGDVTVDEDTSRQWAPVLCHIRSTIPARAYGGPRDVLPLLEGHVGGLVCGQPGGWIEEDEYPDGVHEKYGTVEVRARGTTGHYGTLSSSMRDPDVETFHSLVPRLLEAAAPGNPYPTLMSNAHEVARRAYLHDVAVDAFALIMRLFNTNDLVVVTAWNWASCSLTSRPPSEAIAGAAAGIVFASELGEGDIDEGWHVILLPCLPHDGRLLATIRLLPIYKGRSDVDFFLLNASGWRPSPDVAQKARNASLAYGTVGSDWCPANCGSFYCQGGLWLGEELRFRRLFSDLGHVYGIDEAIIAQRHPVIMPDPHHAQPFIGWKPGMVVENMTVIDPFSGKDGALIECHPARRWTLDALIRAREGFWPKFEELDPLPCHMLYRSVHDAVRQAHEECALAKVPTLGSGSTRLLARRGGRMVRTVNPSRSVGRAGPIVAGGIWRPRDVAFGLRNRLNHCVTQGLSPELWSEVANPTVPADPVVEQELRRGIEILRKWAQTLESGTIVGVASVRTSAQLKAFRTTRKEFSCWVWLTENDALTAPKGDLKITLSTTNGTGFIFQLARLLPACAGRHDTFMSCVNDLETDWFPRAERLAIGMRCMPYTPIIFPAMGLNAPCPFQDVTARMDALNQKNLVDSLVRTCATFGFIYGVDEVWAAQHELPTVAVRWQLGGAATEHFKNPKDAVVYRLQGPTIQAWKATGGNFATFFRAGFRPQAIRRLTDKKIDFDGLIGAPLPLTCTAEQWDLSVEQHATLRRRAGQAVLAIFVWGTRGDRVPLEYIARVLRQWLQVVIVELCSVEEGQEGLRNCEDGKGYHVIPQLLRSRTVTQRCRIRSLVPSYLGGNSESLRYSLAPHAKDASSPRGGLPRLIDWLVPIITSRERRDIRIGCYAGAEWFPRSANGQTPLVVLKNRPRTGRKGYVLGSSSIPVPEKFLAWERIPAGDHYELFQQFDDVASAGGAGVVQTIAAAGAVAHTWSNAIDRTYYDPTNAGAHVAYNAPEESIAAIALVTHFWHVCWRVSPRWWYKAAMIKAQRVAPLKLAWNFLFIGYSFRNTHVRQSFTATVAGAFLPNCPPIVLPLLAGFVSYSWRIWGQLDARPAYARAWSVVLLILRGAASTWVSTLTFIGISTRKSILLAIAFTFLPSWPELLSRLSFGKMTVGQRPGVHLGVTFVWHGGLPVGLHSMIFDTERGILIQGQHVRETGLGEAFRRVDIPAEEAIAMVWVRTDLSSADIPPVVKPVAPYSALFNCQTISATIITSSNTPVSGIVAFVLVVGVFQAWMMLTIASIFAMIGSSAALTVTAIMLPMGDFDAWALKLWEDWTDFFFKAVPLFAERPAEDDPQTLESVHEICTQLAQAAISDGVPEDIVCEALATALPRWLECDPDEEADADSMWHTRRPEASEYANVVRARIRDTVVLLANAMRGVGLPEEIIESLFKLVSTLLTAPGIAATWVATSLAVILDYASPYLFPQAQREAQNLIFAATSHLTNSPLRRKNAWAPLFKKSFDKVRFVDWMTAGMQEFHRQEAADPLVRVIQNMNEVAPDGIDPIDESTKFIRRMRLPARPRVAPHELTYPSLLSSVSHTIDPTLAARALKYETLGGRLGIDGCWLATDDARAEVNSRYLAAPRPWTEAEAAIADEVAEALFKSHPDAFDRPGIVRPETVAKQLIRKFSPSIPLLSRHKRRDELFKNGWMRSIIQATYKRLEEGAYPPQVYHEFAKMQIVTKLRTVVAQDLASYFVDQVVQLERNKRSFWHQANMGMGAPMRSGYLGEVFAAVDARNTAFSADATAFDANVPPVVFKILTRLGELGVRSGGVPKVAEVLRQKYLAMQDALIVDLPTGKVFKKNRGGGTGQSATSWDNHWAMRAVMMMIWSIHTGKPAADFYLTNTVHNTGDDNIWGTDDDIDPDEISAIAREWLGLTIRIEGRGRVTDLSYLGKQPRLAETTAEHGRVPTPKFVAAPLREQFLLRRSAVVSRFSGQSDNVYYDKMLLRAQGHLQNCAYDHELYSLVLREYMEDAASWIGLGPALMWRTKVGKHGYLEACSPTLSRGVRLSQRQTAILQKLRTTHKAPTYQEVLIKDGHPAKVEAPDSKFAYASVPLGWERIARDLVAESRHWFNAVIPDELTRLAPRVDMAPVSPLFWVPGYPVEKFVWRTMWEEDGEVAYDAFCTRLRRSPFSPATDPTGFWWYLETEGTVDRLLKQDLRVLRGRMLCASAAYVGASRLINVLRRTPIFGLLVECYEFYQQDIPKLFSMLSTLYWLDAADSSGSISSLMPADPYRLQKLVAVVCSIAAPDWMALSVGSLWPKGWVGTVVQSIAAMTSARPGNSYTNADAANRVNEWSGEIVQAVVESIDKSKDRGVFVLAETATGKSTKLPAAILNAGLAPRVFLIVPRIVLRANYGNPWLPQMDVNRLAREATLTAGRLKVATYGHMNARLKGPRFLNPEDIVLMDEFHEGDPEMGLLAHRLLNHERKAYLSATYASRYAPGADVFKVGLPRPFQEPVPRRIDLPVVGLFQEAAKDLPDKIGRSLVICPGVKECDAVAAAIIQMGYSAAVVSAKRRNFPVTGVIVATQVVDAGVDIDPPVNVVIDCGRKLTQDKGVFRITATDWLTDKQRRGRAGRRGEGWVYTPLAAGTGPEVAIYPSYCRLIGEESARSWLLQNLQIEDDLERVEDPSPIDPRMSIALANLTLAERTSLCAWWLLSCTFSTEAETIQAYDDVYQRGWPEHLEGQCQLLNSRLNATGVLQRSLIQAYVAAQPFVVLKQGTRRRVQRLTYKEGKIFDM